ncbi:MAG: 4-alpha-glucanotransferase [Oscillibacter sp.]|nr:4-alpha-glucanotransferase [Oscillibacter sp.]
MKRSCGVLLPVSALPSPCGIGTLGKDAYAFVDFLEKAGQSWWQMLPVGPTSYGDSPYQSFSTYAGNPYFVDLETLCEDGLLTEEELAADWGGDPGRVDYEKIYQNRFRLLQKATERGWERDAEKVKTFTEKNAGWLPDYALFMALKRHFGMRAWTEWEDEDIRLHRPEAVERYRRELSEDVRLFLYIQYLFFLQWEKLRAYAHEKGIGIIGDLPIYVAMDSADVWAEPQSFQLDEQNRPKEVSGVPPDYFSADGQLWGNPLYDWDALRADGYGWWIRRIDGAAKLYDILRIDHFRGLESYWAVPAGEETARNGHWVQGPGMDLVRVLKNWFPDILFIAEDLGFLTPEVRQLLKDSEFPGMKVLEFAFDSREPSDYLPHTYPLNCVCYVGTHDNTPIIAWKEEADPEDVALAVRYLGLNDQEGFHWGMIRGGQSSVAELFVAQMQDYLGLGAEARMNTPGKLGGNWQWRLLPGQLTEDLASRMAETARMYGRYTPKAPKPDGASEKPEETENP